jgi:hypothetical protein
MLSPLEGAKQDNIGVTKGANAKCHIIRFVLVYLVENKMPLIHHVVKQYECDCTIKDDKSLNGRTQGHPMLKSKPRLM